MQKKYTRKIEAYLDNKIEAGTDNWEMYSRTAPHLFGLLKRGLWREIDNIIEGGK